MIRALSMNGVNVIEIIYVDHTKNYISEWIETKIMNKTKTDTFKLPFYQADKAVKLFIRDLLLCEKSGIYFKFSGILFNQVYLCGIISFFETRNENIYIKGKY